MRNRAFGSVTDIKCMILPKKMRLQIGGETLLEGAHILLAYFVLRLSLILRPQLRAYSCCLVACPGALDDAVDDGGSFWQIDDSDAGRVLSVVLEKRVSLTPWVRRHAWLHTRTGTCLRTLAA